MVDETLIFQAFGSGSSGNSYYLGTREQGILIDAGISARTIHKYLQAIGVDFNNILGVLITHDHADHIRAVGTLGERVHLPIFTTPEIHAGIDRNYGVKEKLRTSRRYFQKDVEWNLGPFTIQTCSISHDSTDCLCYAIEAFGQHFMIATDCGAPNEKMEAFIRQSNHIVIEANHDEQMLLNGPYPTYLKERILSDRGHQSNETCGELLERNWHDGIRNIWLCHLSQENNDPALAYETIAEHLLEIGIMPREDVYVKVLDRLNKSPLYILNDSIWRD